MSIDKKYGRYCDGCGDTIQKAHRIWDGKDFCATCYKRHFVSRACLRCGASARVHKNSHEDAICRKCSLEGRTCQRCSKPIIGKSGMISAGMPVCPSCTPYFREPRPCEQCGRPSTRLSSMPQMGIHAKICDRCRNSASCKTCSVCRKSRKVAGYTDANSPYCAQCVPGQEITHACPGCNTTLPGAGNAKCRPCINKDRILKDAAMLAATLDHAWAKDFCVNFAHSLWERKKDSPGLAKLYQAHQPMLQRLDATYAEIVEISPDTLLRDFGTATLRKHLLVRRYLEEALSIKVSQSSREDAADRDRIKVKLAEHGGKPWGPLLKEYASWLDGLDISTRTRRLYIATAATFCAEIKIGPSGWTENQAQRHLLRHPGAYSNLLRFVGFCSEVRGWKAVIPPQSRILNIRTKTPATVVRLRKLLDMVNAEGPEHVQDSVLCRVLALSFGLTIAKMRSIPRENFTSDGNGLKFKVGSDSVEIPTGLLAIAQAYLQRMAA